MENFQQVSTPTREPSREQSLFTFQSTQLIWLFLGLLESLFVLRLLLELVGSNLSNPFAALLYGFTGVFLVPFVGVIGTVTTGTMVLEISTVIAMVVYACLAWMLERVFWIIFYRPYAAVPVTTGLMTDRRSP